MDAPELYNNAEEMSDNAEEMSNDTKRLELIRLSEEGEISQSIKHLKKASGKTISKIYSEYEHKQMDNTCTQLTDILITKFSELMGELDVVDKEGDLTSELRNDKLLQGNVKSAVRFIIPFIPFIGLVSGGATLGKHVVKHKRKNTTISEEN